MIITKIKNELEEGTILLHDLVIRKSKESDIISIQTIYNRELRIE